MNENLIKKNLIKNNSIENKDLNYKICKSKKYKKNNKSNNYNSKIIRDKKINNLSLSKYVNKTNNSINNNNKLKFKNNKKLDEQEKNNIKISPYKKKDYIYKTNNIFINYNNYSTHKNRNRNFSDKKENNTYYDFTKEKSINKKLAKFFFFPDNKFTKIKKLKNDKILNNFEKDYINILKYKNKDYRNINYLINISCLLPNNNGNKNLHNERINHINTSIDENNSNNYYAKKYSTFKWALFIIKLEKYIMKRIIITFGYLLLNELNKISLNNLKNNKKYKLINIIKNQDKKIIKKYFRKFKEITLIEKIKQIYSDRNDRINNSKRKERNKRRINNLKNKAQLFITKTSNKTKNINTIYYKNIHLFIEQLKLIIHKINLRKHYIYLKDFLTSKCNIDIDKKVIINKENKNKDKKIKKHIKIKYVRRISEPILERNLYSLSFKTCSSDYSRSTINSAKKMKVYKRIVYINSSKNNIKNNNLQSKMTNIILNICKKEIIKFFYKWKNNSIISNKKRKNTDKRFFYFFLTKLFYHKKNIEKINYNILLGSSMYIWKRYCLD